MSIFKETLSDTIQTQLQARQNVISGDNYTRTNLLPWYLSKNSWVRMTSFVNYTSGVVDFDGKGKIETNGDGHYKDDQLSKKYILEGGTLYTKTNGTDVESALRKGLLTADGVYGGNIDARPDGTAESKYYRTFGIRPMPGITGIDLRTIGAYGSLFETTVKFYAWDVNQLNELEILFMRPGYSVLLEWGWSQYLNYDDKNNTAKTALKLADIYPEVCKLGTINPFENLTQQDVYDKLEALRVKYKHNYDGMLGYVKNFNWKMMKNGGFECTTTLISMGEAINTLKVSSNANEIHAPASSIDASDIDKRKYTYDDYENILISLKSISETTNKFNYLNNKTVIDENEYRGNWDYNKNYVGRGTIQQKLTDNGWSEAADNLSKQPVLKPLVKGDDQNPSKHGSYYEYISLDVWVAIMESYFNFKVTDTKDKSGKNKLAKIYPPGKDDYCLACKDSISTDPSVCLVSNPFAFTTEFPFVAPNEYSSIALGIQPPIYTVQSNGDNTLGVDTSTLSTFPSFYDDTAKAGLLGNIYVNIDLLLNEFKNVKNSANDEGVNFMVYTQNILNKISNALGGLNNFKFSTAGRDQNINRIVDLYYLEQNANPKYELDLMGLGSICRNVDIESQIFQEQSTIVAIAAQSRANLGDIYNSTQVYLNAGLEDRIALSKYQGKENQDTSGKSNDYFYQKLFDFLVYVRNYVVGDQENFAIETDSAGNIPYTFLKQFMMKYNGELNFKALIPFKLKITLDGIGGIVVGQIFRVKQNILPKNYYDKNLGFIVTKINHELTNNDWTTTLETQICVLDQQDFYDASGKHKLTANVNREGFGVAVNQAFVEGLFYPILVSFLEALTYESIAGYIWASTSDKNKTGLVRIVSEYLTKNNTDDFKTYWNNKNTKVFIDSSANVATISDFRGYVIEYVDLFKKMYPTEINTPLSTDTTLGQALDSLLTKPENQDYLTKIQAILTPDQGAKWFSPIGSNALDFTRFYDNSTIQINPNTKQERYNLNRKYVLDNVIDKIATPNFSDIKNKYENLNTGEVFGNKTGYVLVPIENNINNKTKSTSTLYGPLDSMFRTIETINYDRGTTQNESSWTVDVNTYNQFTENINFFNADYNGSRPVGGYIFENKGG
jgi:hypothetical protein